MQIITNPQEIEKLSFEIITEQLADRQMDEENASVIKRVIHTTADFDYVENLCFSEGAAAALKQVFQNGARIVTDTRMAMAGINKKAATRLGCDIHCFIDAPEVHEIAQRTGCTRARAAVDHAVKILEAPLVFVVGNAPTALIRLHELIKGQGVLPAAIIAVPVGFVNVVESKELILGLDIPHIVAKGQKGGSNVAAAICNALLYETLEGMRT